MKLFLRKFGPVLLMLVLAFSPLVGAASFDEAGFLPATGPGPSTGVQTGPGPSTGVQTGPGPATGYPPNSIQPSYTQSSYSQTSGSYRVENPLRVSNFCDLLKIVLQAIMILGLPVAVVFLVIVGFQFILARGSDTGLTKAKANLLYTVIGIAIFLGAWTIAEVIKSTLQALGVSGFGSC